MDCEGPGRQHRGSLHQLRLEPAERAAVGEPEPPISGTRDEMPGPFGARKVSRGNERVGEAGQPRWYRGSRSRP